MKALIGIHECQNCENVFAAENLDDVENLDARVAPGETVPSGQCPECGALTQEITTDEYRKMFYRDAADGVLHDFTLSMRPGTPDCLCWMGVGRAILVYATPWLDGNVMKIRAFHGERDFDGFYADDRDFELTGNLHGDLQRYCEIMDEVIPSVIQASDKTQRDHGCTACYGLGFILAQSERGVEIQKCDTCDQYKSDDDANEAAYKLAACRKRSFSMRSFSLGAQK